MTDDVEFGALTSTRPQHAAMFSGYLANTTGIWTNDPSQNPSGAGLPEGYSVFERVKNYSSQVYVAGATAKADHVADLLGFGGPPPGEVEVTWTNAHGFDAFVVHSRLLRDYLPSINDTSNNVAGERCLELAQDTPPFLYVFHFSDPDKNGHTYGFDSTQYRDAIRACDNITGLICDKLASSAPGVIVTSDHGFGKPTPTGHSGTPNTFLATNLPIRHEAAREVDVAPTIYNWLDVPIGGFVPVIEGHSLLSVPGDVSGVINGVPDGVVDVIDIDYLCVLFGSQLGGVNWRPNGDINHDDKVNMRDIGIACRNYAKT
jgi:arylsulfatase A-like enzyme